MAKEDPPYKYNLDDLGIAMGNYTHARTKEKEALRMIESKQNEIKSFQETLDKASEEVQRYRNEVNKILKGLE